MTARDQFGRFASEGDFGAQVRRFAVDLEATTTAVFVNTAAAVHESIVNGSPITGAPGQPVDTGALKASFILDFRNATEAEISTNIEYAPYVEDGIAGKNDHPHYRVGGPHSVKLTIAGAPQLLENEARKLGGGVQ